MRILPDNYIGAFLLCTVILFPISYFAPAFLLPSTSTLEIIDVDNQDLQKILTNPDLTLISSILSKTNHTNMDESSNRHLVRLLLPIQIGFNSFDIPKELSIDPLLKKYQYSLERKPHQESRKTTILLILLSGILGCFFVLFNRIKHQS